MVKFFTMSYETEILVLGQKMTRLVFEKNYITPV